MGRRDTVISLAVLVLCGAILVLFTDLEVGIVRWFSCGPQSPSTERQSELCNPSAPRARPDR